ncbi:glycoside hydrolase family 26 protein [Marinilabilia rubra]|uniref:Mannan endo-1,4-beta-mannosidase n=1 Tax=Marinilabilia rubra TaxID=2162893 RepID=A0A2U2B8L0_9BACT|nr:glycosyl hydrolase [Marinilabilia rubra]PWD99382.1 beta-mannosidase [Marinilabilia rubra]
MTRITLLFALGLVLFSCKNNTKDNESRSPSSKLFEQLKVVEGNGVLFGHQDDLAYGVNWAYQEDRSDVKETAGDYPALFGWELGGIELGRQVNLDSVPFDKMREYVIKGYEMGAVITFSWHPFSALDNTRSSWDTDQQVVKHIIPGGSHHDIFKQHLDKVAAFFHSLKTKNGNPVPFIFRPWHEMDGDWFWWGNSHCTSDEFKTLFRFTVEYLKTEKGVDFLTAYSPDNRFSSEEEYLTWYPGDDVVEIIGVDNYGDFRVGSENVEAAQKKLEIVVEYARKTNKIAAFTETGLNMVTDDQWFTQKLAKSFLESEVASEIAYVMLWRNDDTTHFFSAYPEHSSAPDFRKFTDHEKIWLLDDWNSFKDSLNLKSEK